MAKYHYIDLDSSTDKKGEKKKAMAKTSWYKPSDSVIFVPSTPGSALAKVYREVLEKELTSVNIKVKVVDIRTITYKISPQD